MTQDRGDDLSPGDARAIALSERATSKRGICLDDAMAREYGSLPLLTLEEACACWRRPEIDHVMRVMPAEY